MAFLSFLKKTISDFRGAWTIQDQVQQNASRASLCNNMQFSPSQVFTRDGFVAGFALGSGKIRTFYNWLFLYLTTEYSRLVFLEAPDKIRMLTINTGGFDDLYTQACAGLSCVEAETRLYIGHYDSTGNRIAPMRIANLLFVNAHLVDQAFPDAPNSVGSFTYTEGSPSSGVVTAGYHQFCFRVETRSGFPGRISGSIGNFTASGGRTLQVSITLALGDDAAFVHLGMTTVDNIFQYWEIPGALLTAFNGVTHTYTFNVNIADEDLVVLPDSADLTDYFNLLTLNTGAPAPSKVVAFGNRNVYLDNTKAFISDPYNLQWLLDPDNVVQVEGQRRLICAGSLGGTLVLFGPDWTFTQDGDNATKPREWAPPKNISGQIGTMCVEGAIPNSGYQFLWVAHESGLYTFNGAYSAIPISYMFDPDWKRINWSAARSKLKMVDVAKQRTLYVLVPIDGATEANAVFRIDYSRARQDSSVDPLQVDFSLDYFNNYSEIDSIGLIQDYTTKQTTFQRGMPNGVTQKQDPASKGVDVDQAIHSLYETGLNLTAAEQTREFMRFSGMHAQLAGNGQMQVTPYGLGSQVSSDDPVLPIQLEASPNGDAESLWNMQSENQTIRMETTGLGEWFSLSKLKAYYKPEGTSKK